MTTTTGSATPAGNAVAKPADVTATIDGIEVHVPKGTLIIRAAEQAGIQIPRFCDHPLLKPAGACRQCLVDVAMPDREGNVRPMPKPQASCTMEVTPGMVVNTQHTSPVAEKAQRGVLELLLINHPLDCPICDKGGECPLQNQAMSNGPGESRFIDTKRTFPKPVAVSTQILLDRERCVLCQRCTRFCKQIPGDAFIDLQKRGASQQIGRFDETVLDFEVPDDAAGDHEGPVGLSLADTSGMPFASYYSGNVVQICPVGALTSAAYRFRSRPFDLVSCPTVAEHDSCGAAIRVDHRRGAVLRRLSGNAPEINEEWITDKDRFAFTWQASADRITRPMVRDRNTDGTRGELRETTWAEALQVAAEGLVRAKADRGVAVLPGGRLTIEDAYAYAKFARVALGTNDIDHRVRVHSDEEASFLAHAVAGTGLGVTFEDLETAPAVLLVGLEAEEEAGVTFLRLRKGAVANQTAVYQMAPFATRGAQRMLATLLPTRPGAEAAGLDRLLGGSSAPDSGATSTDGAGTDATSSAAAGTDVTSAGAADPFAVAAADLRREGAIILVGERLAAAQGAYSAVLRLAERTGARLAWIPRRIGERAGVETGTLPGLLPGGRPVTDAAAAAQVGAVWHTEVLERAGRDAQAILDGLAERNISGVVVGGVDLGDFPDPSAARAALATAATVISLEVRHSPVTELADVVLPVAPPVEKAGTYWNWEGRLRPFVAVLESSAMADHRVLHMLADAMGQDLGTATAKDVLAEFAALPAWTGARAEAPAVAAAEPAAPRSGDAVLASWRLMLDAGRCQDGELFLAGTAKRPVARMSAATAAGLGLSEGKPVRVSTARGDITVPLVITDMVDAVVWVPMCSRGSRVHESLAAAPGDVVHLAPGPRADQETQGEPK